MPCNDVVGDLRAMLPPYSGWSEDGGRMALFNAGVLPHHYSVTTQKTITWIFIIMKISSLKLKHACQNLYN